jgi:hypothetical protein
MASAAVLENVTALLGSAFHVILDGAGPLLHDAPVTYMVQAVFELRIPTMRVTPAM